MDYVTGDNHLEFYTLARFKKLSSRMLFYPSLANKLVWRLANRYPERYERRWAWIFPAWYLLFELEVLKKTYRTFSNQQKAIDGFLSCCFK